MKKWNFFRLLSRLGRIFTASLVILLMLSACAMMTPRESDEASPFEWDAKTLYDKGKTALTEENYSLAIYLFNILRYRHPGDAYAQQGLLELAFAYYKNNQGSAAVATADEFIESYSQHSNIDYAYYLRGLPSYYEAVHAFSLLAPETDLNDQTPLAALETIDYFTQFIENYPASRYVVDAQQRMKYINDLLAKIEIKNALSALANKKFGKAAYYAKIVVDHYPESDSKEQAMKIIIESYEKLGLKELVADVLSDRVITEEMLRKQRAGGEQITPASILFKEGWFETQNPRHHTIQILSSPNEQHIRNFVLKERLTGTFGMFKREVKGKIHYALTYNTYPRRGPAISAARQLPRNIGIKWPQIRSFKDIQKEIKAFNAKHKKAK